MANMDLKKQYADSIRDGEMPEHAVQLGIEVLGSQWAALGNALGCVELAYRRGYQAGFEDSRDKKPYCPRQAEAAKEKNDARR